MDWQLPPYALHFARPVLGTMTPPSWAELGMYFSAILALGASAWAATVTRRNGKEANAITAAEKAWHEMREMRKEHKADRAEWEREREEDREERERDREEREELRLKVEASTRLFTLSVGYTEQIIRHIRSGGGEPLPTTPEDLRPHFSHLFDHTPGDT